jgi:hypothetical protein
MRKVFRLSAILLMQLCVVGLLSAQEFAKTQNDNSCLAVLGGLGPISLSEMRAEVQRLRRREPLPADLNFKVAELMERLGDYDASDYYEQTIKADPKEPCYESFYADYLRNFRGAATPLFPRAEEHYFEGRRKLKL